LERLGCIHFLFGGFFMNSRAVGLNKEAGLFQSRNGTKSKNFKVPFNSTFKSQLFVCHSSAFIRLIPLIYASGANCIGKITLLRSVFVYEDGS